MARGIGKLSVTISKILKARGMQDRLHEYHIFGQWEPAVGPAIARHAQPQLLRGGKLVLVVDSPAWMQQLSLMKPEIMEKLNAGLGRDTIRGITLKLGVVTSSDEGLRADKSGRPDLTSDERATIERHVHGIGDGEIREAIRRVFEKDVLSRKKGK